MALHRFLRTQCKHISNSEICLLAESLLLSSSLPAQEVLARRPHPHVLLLFQPVLSTQTYLNCGELEEDAIEANAESPGSCGNEALW
jgi:hypothetical protein